LPDAVVIGAGPNGLVAANVLADAGWSVVVLEEQPVPGGAVKTAWLTEPGFRHDVFSAFYPLAAASPAMRALELERYGLKWRRAPLVVAHPASDGTCVSLSTDIDETCASIDAFAPGDGEAWRELYALWQRTGEHVLQSIARPMPPVVPALRLAGALGPAELVRFARFSALPVRRLADERFRGAGGGRLLAGNALHTDNTPEQALGGFFGWLLCSVGQQLGFPLPEGGAGGLAAALVRRLEEHGGEVRCGVRVDEVLVRRRRAVGVHLADGTQVEAKRGVFADVGVRQLYLDLLPGDAVPARVRDDLRVFEPDAATVKVDWALERPIPWNAEDARRSAVVHVADSMDELTVYASELARGLVPAKPFLVFGQYALADETRCPPGKEVAWAYAHVPQRVRGDAGGDGIIGIWDERETEAFAARIEARVEELAPGFRGSIRARHVLTPARLQAANRNLEGGSINGGTAQLHQQLVLRPAASLGRPETGVRGLYLASASAHPGGGVHGLPGWNAAHAALHAGRAARVALAVGAAAALASRR
jgi:phytoene dehydrogenase-like protein